MSLPITGENKDKPLWLTWGLGGEGLPLTADFQSVEFEAREAEPGEGLPRYDDPDSLYRLPSGFSDHIVTTVQGATVVIGGQPWDQWVTSLDCATPLNGPVVGAITLLSPMETAIKSGDRVNLAIMLPGVTVGLLAEGYVTEPPKAKWADGLVGTTVAVGDILEYRRATDTGRIEPYCGPLPRTVSEAADVYTRARGLPFVGGGDLLVEGITPDFVEMAPHPFLSELYAPLNTDVRTSSDGTIIAVPRLPFDRERAILITAAQALEVDFDSPAFPAYSRATAYNNFDRDLGLKTDTQETSDFSGWDASNTEPWFLSNNTYTLTKKAMLGDTAIQTTVETWGYMPNSSVVPKVEGARQDPCEPNQETPDVPISTRLDVISLDTEVLAIEGHISGAYVVTGVDSYRDGWGTYANADGDTVLYNGQLESRREEYQHTVEVGSRVCPQYWPVLRVAKRATRYSRVAWAEGEQPTLQLVSQLSELWEQSTEAVGEGQVKEWRAVSTTRTFDSKAGRWVGGNSDTGRAFSPPFAQFVGSAKVPVQLEVSLEFPEFRELFGDREAGPIRVPNAFTSEALTRALERQIRESTGLAYGLMLVVDPRLPLRPGASVIYEREGGSRVEGIVFSREFNVSGTEVTQSVVLMRSFTEPGLAAVRNRPGFTTSASVSNANPCE